MRAGGGIGDEIEAPDGDDNEAYRILFDFTFFFFVIVILLAIIQGIFHSFLLIDTKLKIMTLFSSNLIMYSVFASLQRSLACSGPGAGKFCFSKSKSTSWNDKIYICYEAEFLGL